MEENMKIYNVQMIISQQSADENYLTAEKWIRKAGEEGADVVVLPELWNTAFHMDENVIRLADVDGLRTQEFLSGLAKEYHMNIVGGSVTVKEGDRLYNRSYIYNREGELIETYDKVHLFSYVKEENYFERGSKPGIFELDGHKCGIVICYDTRFLEWVRLYALAGVEVLFSVAEWPIKRLPHWKSILQTRAIENQFFVSGTNFASLKVNGKFAGESAVYDPWGVRISETLEEEGLVVGEVDFSRLEEIRSTINVYRDRRTDLYDVVAKDSRLFG